MLVARKELIVFNSEVEEWGVRRLVTPHLGCWCWMRRRRALPQPLKSIGLKRWRRWLVTVEGDVVVLLFNASRRGCPGRDLGLRLLASEEKLLFVVVEADAERERRRVRRRVHPSLLRLAASRGKLVLITVVVVEVEPQRERRRVGHHVPPRLLASVVRGGGRQAVVVQIDAQRKGGGRKVHPGGGLKAEARARLGAELDFYGTGGADLRRETEIEMGGGLWRESSMFW
jgi:hypothetical protein